MRGRGALGVGTTSVRMQFEREEEGVLGTWSVLAGHLSRYVVRSYSPSPSTPQ